MKLIARTATFQCLGETLHFDVSVLIDEENNRQSFSFKPHTELQVKYAMPEIGFNIEATLKNEIQAMQILLPNVQLAKELSDCLSEYISKFSQTEL